LSLYLEPVLFNGAEVVHSTAEPDWSKRHTTIIKTD
jgi:hypothetical protein